MLLANIISHLFAASCWEIITGSSSVFGCLLQRELWRMQEEGDLQRVDAPNLGMDGVTVLGC